MLKRLKICYDEIHPAVKNRNDMRFYCRERNARQAWQSNALAGMTLGSLLRQ